MKGFIVKIVCNNYSFRGALFAMVMSLAKTISWFITIITLGWIGKDWALEICYYELGHPWSFVYDDNIEHKNT